MTTLTTADSNIDLDARLKSLIESDPSSVSNPYPLYRDLLNEAPVYVWGPTVVVSGFDAVKTVADDAENYSNRGYSVGSRAQAIRDALTDEQRVAFDEVSAFEALYVSRMDGEEHARLRSIAQRAFRPRKLASLSETVQAYVDQMIDEMRNSGKNDLIENLTSRLPIIMICSLLDVPLEDVPLIRGWAARIGKNRGGAVVEDLIDAHEALKEFRAYVSKVVNEHYATDESPTDLVAALQGAEKEERLAHDELLATVVVLLFGGSDTTTALLGNGLHAMLSDPEQWNLLASDPENYTFGAVEEIIRYISPVQTTWRVTTAPTELEGVQIPANNTVLLMIGAANRDTRKIENPDILDIARGETEHLAFLSGVHFCIGAALARLEANTVFKTLATRFPNLSLASDEPGKFVGNIQFRTIAELRVDWGD